MNEQEIKKAAVNAMKLTGKSKREFEKWYNELDISIEIPIAVFQMGITESMQFGVYQDFFDSVDLSVCAEGDATHGFCATVYSALINKLVWCEYDFKTRQLARAASVDKANEIYNASN